MYHPYQNVETKQSIKERREMAGIAQQERRMEGQRLNLFSILRSILVSLISRSGGESSPGTVNVQRDSKKRTNAQPC